MTPLAKLKAAALAATPGPWVNGYPNAGTVHPTPGEVWSEEKDCIASDVDPGNAAYIASASPDVVLALVASVEDLQEALEHIIEGTHSINKMAGIENVARNALTRHSERFP